MTSHSNVIQRNIVVIVIALISLIVSAYSTYQDSRFGVAGQLADMAGKIRVLEAKSLERDGLPLEVRTLQAEVIDDREDIKAINAKLDEIIRMLREHEQQDLRRYREMKEP